MLVQVYIEALLVDEEMADMVWEAWSVGLIPDEMAALAWSCIVLNDITGEYQGQIDEVIQ